MHWRLVLCGVSLMVGCADPAPTVGAPAQRAQEGPEPPANPSTWAGLHRLDGRVELRAADAGRWVVLRRLAGVDWIRGYTHRGTLEAQCGTTRRLVAASPGDDRAPRRFWLHAAELRALLADDDCALSIGRFEIDRDDAAALAAGGDDVDVEVLGAPLDRGLDHAIQLRVGGGGFTTSCHATIALNAAGEVGWVLVDGVTPGAGGTGLPDACPDPPGWALVDTDRAPFASVGGFLDRMSGRSSGLEVCPGAASRAQLRAMVDASTLDLCGPECCAPIDDAARAALGDALDRWDTLNALAAARPGPDALGPPPTPPD